MKFKELGIQSMGIRTVSIKYEAQLVICKGISSFFVVDNYLKNSEKTMITDRAQGMQRKAVPIYLQHHVLGIEAVQGHALGTCNRIQKSQRSRGRRTQAYESQPCNGLLEI